MQINKIELFDNNSLVSRIKFDKSTVIYSVDNSKGKTSLIRLVLYSLLFPVSSTAKLNFGNYLTILNLSKDNGKRLIIQRFPNKVAQIIFEDNSVLKYDLNKKSDFYNAMSVIFNIENTDLIDNLVGCFYIDQDIGWSVANHGLVAKPNITFDIDDLLGNIRNAEEIANIKRNIRNVEKEIKKYTAIKDIYAYKKSGDFLDDNIPKNTLLDQLYSEKARFEARLESENKLLETISSTLDSDKSFKSLIENMNLIVNHSGMEKFVLSTNDIYGFEERFDMLRAKYFEITHNVKLIKDKLESIAEEIKEKENPFSIKTLSDEFINKVPDIESFNQVDVNGVILQLRKEKKILNSRLINLAKLDTQNQIFIQNCIKRYTKVLEVEESYLTTTRGVLYTRENSLWSGAILNKIVLSYRCAYCKLIENLFGIKLPLIIDSPGASEMSDENVKIICKMIFGEFSNNQIIVSSIYPSVYNSEYFSKKICLESKLLDYSDKE